MHTKISTSPQMEKMSTGVGQPSAQHQQEEIGEEYALVLTLL